MQQKIVLLLFFNRAHRLLPFLLPSLFLRTLNPQDEATSALDSQSERVVQEVRLESRP